MAVFFIPQRYVLGLMGFLAIVNAYTMRVSLSIAITEMVAASNSTEIDDPDACPADDSGSSGSVTVSDFHIASWFSFCFPTNLKFCRDLLLLF